MVEEFKSTPEEIKTLLRHYRTHLSLIPEQEWESLSGIYINLVDEDKIPFDRSLGVFCQSLCESLTNTVMASKFGDCDNAIERYGEESLNSTMEDIFKSINLGVLYGYGLGKLMHDTSIKEGECVL